MLPAALLFRGVGRGWNDSADLSLRSSAAQAAGRRMNPRGIAGGSREVPLIEREGSAERARSPSARRPPKRQGGTRAGEGNELLVQAATAPVRGDRVGLPRASMAREGADEKRSTGRRGFGGVKGDGPRRVPPGAEIFGRWAGRRKSVPSPGRDKQVDSWVPSIPGSTVTVRGIGGIGLFCCATGPIRGKRVTSTVI